MRKFVKRIQYDWKSNSNPSHCWTHIGSVSSSPHHHLRWELYGYLQRLIHRRCCCFCSCCHLFVCVFLFCHRGKFIVKHFYEHSRHRIFFWICLLLRLYISIAPSSLAFHAWLGFLFSWNQKKRFTRFISIRSWAFISIRSNGINLFNRMW